jgi:hypothetical protein
MRMPPAPAPLPDVAAEQIQSSFQPASMPMTQYSERMVLEQPATFQRTNIEADVAVPAVMPPMLPPLPLQQRMLSQTPLLPPQTRLGLHEIVEPILVKGNEANAAQQFARMTALPANPLPPPVQMTEEMVAPAPPQFAEFRQFRSEAVEATAPVAVESDVSVGPPSMPLPNGGIQQSVQYVGQVPYKGHLYWTPKDSGKMFVKQFGGLKTPFLNPGDLQA